MRRYVAMLVMLAVCGCCMGQWHYEFSWDKVNKEACTFLTYHHFDAKTGIETNTWTPLYGNVYGVKDGDGVKPDVKVRVARKGETPEYFVGVVKDYADECGLWRYVTDPNKARLKVKFVNGVADICIKIDPDGESCRDMYKDMPVHADVNGRTVLVAKWVDYKFIVIVQESQLERMRQQR